MGRMYVFVGLYNGSALPKMLYLIAKRMKAVVTENVVNLIIDFLIIFKTLKLKK
jgi:hypothetical protein